MAPQRILPIGVALLLVLSNVSYGQTTIVEWGGNFVSTSVIHGHSHYDGSSSDDWGIAHDGVTGYASRAFDLSNELTPSSGYTPPAFRNGRFFGGYSAAVNASPAIPGDTTGTASGHRTVHDNGSADRILFQGSGNRSKIRGAIVFPKTDFLREASETSISFQADSELRFHGILDGWRPLARWLVRDGSTWYISQTTLHPQSTYNVAETRTLANPNATLWAAFSPQQTDANGRAYFSPPPSSFAAHSFTDVTAVGVYFDSFSSTTSLGGTSFSRFALEEFAVKATVQAPPVTVLQNSIINDTISDAMMPTSLTKAANGDLILAFNDGGDLSAGSSGYLSRSTDQGATWAAPYQTFQSSDPAIGTLTTIASLPDGSLLLGVLECVHPLYPNQNLAYRYTRIHLLRSVDNGVSFQPLSTLVTPPLGLSIIIGPLCRFPNGDLALPAYILPNHTGPEIGYTYGSGFFRSTDGGTSWGMFEKAFQDPPPSVGHPLYFTESTFLRVTHEDGNPLDDPIVALARIDTDPAGQYSNGVPHSLWKTFSTDNGVTWSSPVPVGISGIWPAALPAGSHSYLMVCGDREANPPRKVSFFTSRDGENYVLQGHPPYARTGGCLSTATGGAQAIVELSPGLFYLAYYAKDPSLGGIHQTYLEGCTIRVGNP